jgi:hypothetical protein
MTQVKLRILEENKKELDEDMIKMKTKHTDDTSLSEELAIIMMFISSPSKLLYNPILG